jgi:hypothetical protein
VDLYNFRYDSLGIRTLDESHDVCLPGERVPGHCLRLHLRSAIALWCNSTSVRKVAVFDATRSLETNQSARPPLAPPDGAALAIRGVFVLL